MQIITQDHTFESVIYNKEEINTIWHKVKDEIKRTDCEFLDHKDIKKLLLCGDYILWVVKYKNTDNIVGVGILEIVFYIKHTISRVVSIGGNQIDKWLNTHKTAFEDWSKHIGCTHVDFCGRKGWKKILSDYEEDSIIFRKKL